MDGALRQEVERGENAPEAGIGGERADQGLGRDDLVGEILHIGDRQEQHAFAAEEIAALGHAHRLEEVRHRREPLGQRVGRIGCEIGRLGVDDDREEIDVLREGAVHLGLALAPRQVRRDELVGVGVDADVARGVIGAGERQQQQDQRHRPRVAAARIDDHRQPLSHHASR